MVLNSIVVAMSLVLVSSLLGPMTLKKFENHAVYNVRPNNAWPSAGDTSLATLYNNSGYTDDYVPDVIAKRTDRKSLIGVGSTRRTFDTMQP